MSEEIKKNAWLEFMADYDWEDENEERLWYCAHGKAYGIRCKKCEEEDE